MCMYEFRIRFILLRNPIRNLPKGVFGISMRAGFFFPERYDMTQIAAQMYTLRDYCKTPADIATTLAKVEKDRL